MASGASAKIWTLLNRPAIWRSSRIGLDLTIGLYRKRIAVMREWDLLQGNPSLLDIGCGIGQYASITEGEYLGVDLEESYIAYARTHKRRPNQTFRCTDVTNVLDEDRQFDLVLMVDFLHHISDEDCIRLLDVTAQLAKKAVVSFEPVSYQPNPLGKWIVGHDRGNYVRSLERLHALFDASRLRIEKSVEMRLGPINTRAILARPPSHHDGDHGSP
jgi:2-polyprenyl-3-methyl-5-hydroxy-6-metoxy-1,4-benzoquinol methylase